MIDLYRMRGQNYGYYVKAGFFCAIIFLDIGVGGSYQKALLLFGHRFFGFAENDIAARFHLHKNQMICCFGNNIQLVFQKSPVAVQNTISFRCQISRNGIFALFPEFVMFGHTPCYSTKVIKIP